MVLKVKAPPLDCWNLMIERLLPTKYGLKRVKLNRYITFDRAKELHPTITFSYLVLSKTVYAIEWNGTILIHPDSLLKILKQKLKAITKAALKEPKSRRSPSLL